MGVGGWGVGVGGVAWGRGGGGGAALNHSTAQQHWTGAAGTRQQRASSTGQEG